MRLSPAAHRAAAARRAAEARARQRRATPHPASRARPGRLLWLALGIASGALLGPDLALRGLARWAPAQLELRALHVSGLQAIESDQIAAATGVVPGDRLDRLDLERIGSRLAALPWVAEAHVVRLPPQRLGIALREHRAVARARRAADGALWWVDAEGRAFAGVDAAPAARAADAQAPILLGVAFEPGTAHAVLARGAALAARLAALGLPAPREIALAGEADEALPWLRLEGLAPRVRLGPDLHEEKLARLVRLLAAGLPEVATASEIDLRFAGRTVLRSGSATDGAETAGVRGFAPPPGAGPAG